MDSQEIERIAEQMAVARVDLDTLITEAVAAERERCAQLAERHFIYGHAVAGPGFAAHLAKQIREGKEVTT